MRHLPTTVLAAALCAAAPVHAADTGDAGGDAGEQPPTGTPRDIIVSALRVPLAQARVPSSITVLDYADILAAQPVALTDILVTTPGITLARNGGYGEVTSLRIRGAEPGQTVVVIDGMRLADATATDGGFDFSQLFVDDAARIEILRGPQSILWGSDAIGGVINITTRAATRPIEADIALEAGSHQTFNAHAAIGGTSRWLDWRLSGSDFTTAGIPTIAGGTVANGYSRQAASGTATVHLSPTVSLDLRGYWNGARDSYSDSYSTAPAIYPGDYAFNKQWSAYAGLNVSLFSGRFTQRLAVLQNQTDSEDFTPASPPALSFVGHGRIRRYEYQGTLALAPIELVFGAEREESAMRSGTPYDLPVPYNLVRTATTINSVYGEARVSPVRGLTLNAGLRYDHNSRFGGNTVVSAGGVYTPDGGITVLRATYDEGFKAPSLYQLFSAYGDPTLAPERARGWQAGAERALFARAVTLGATWWQRQTDNLIEFQNCPYPLPASGAPGACYVNFFGYYANIGKVRAHGAEASAALRLRALTLQANYSLVVAEDRTPGDAGFGAQLQRVPRHGFNASARYAVTPRFAATLSVRQVGDANDFDYATGLLRTLGAFALVDLRAEWTLPMGLTLFGRVENIGDRVYQTAYGYNALRRTANFGVRGHF